MCEIGPKHLGEFGVYDLTINNDGCSFSTALQPVNEYLAILYSFLIILGLVLVYNLISFGRHRGYLSPVEKSVCYITRTLYPEEVMSLKFNDNNSTQD